MTRVMTLEEEDRLMLSKGNILRKGKDNRGKPIEYWDIPRNAEDFAELKAQRAKMESKNG